MPMACGPAVVIASRTAMPLVVRCYQGPLGSRRRWRRSCAGPSRRVRARRRAPRGRPRTALAGRGGGDRGARAGDRAAAGLRPVALRTRRRAHKEQPPLDVALAAADLPLRRGSLRALVVENVAGCRRATRPAGWRRWSPACAGRPPDRRRRDLERRRRGACRGGVPFGRAHRDRPGMAARRRIAHRWCRASGCGPRGAFRPAVVTRWAGS